MLNWLIDASLKNRKLVLVIALLAVATGAMSLSQLSIDAFPDVTDVMVQINTVAPALSPFEIEQQISAKIEAALGGLPNLKLVRSMSKFGLSQVTVVFEDGTDLYFARAQVLERLQSVELPAGLPRPTMGPVATGLGEIYHYIITAPGGDLADTRVIHDWVVKPQLLSVPGVAEVNAWGGIEKQFHVVADPARLVKHGLSMRDVLETLERSNTNVGGGVAKASGEILLVHGIGLVTNIQEIGGITIASHDGRAVRIRDVADVVEGQEIRRGVVTAEGQGEVVLGLGFMLMGQNSHEVAARLKARMEEVKKNPELKGAQIRVVYDRTELVDFVIHTVKKNLFEGALLVIAILFLFLGHFRAALIVAAAIPLSMLFAFNLMLRVVGTKGGDERGGGAGERGEMGRGRRWVGWISSAAPFKAGRGAARRAPEGAAGSARARVRHWAPGVCSLRGLAFYVDPRPRAGRSGARGRVPSRSPFSQRPRYNSLMMRLGKSGARRLLALWAPCLILSGCATGRQKAEESKEIIKVGMTSAEVKGKLGEPLQKWTEPGPTEVWLYRYEPGPNKTVKVVLTAVAVAAVVALVVVAARGGGSVGSLGGVGGGGDPRLYEFRVYFGPDGRVKSLSDVRPVEKP